MLDEVSAPNEKASNNPYVILIFISADICFTRICFDYSEVCTVLHAYEEQRGLYCGTHVKIADVLGLAPTVFNTIVHGLVTN